MPRRDTRSRPVEIGLGFGLFVLVATLPAQVISFSNSVQPAWVGVVLGGAAATSTLGALGAAYFSFQQARQASRTRNADYYAPLLDSVLKAALDSKHRIRSLGIDVTMTEAPSGHAGVNSAFRNIHGELAALQEAVKPLEHTEFELIRACVDELLWDAYGITHVDSSYEHLDPPEQRLGDFLIGSIGVERRLDDVVTQVRQAVSELLRF